MSFVVITDSTSDLPLELRQKYSIDYLKMSFSSDSTDYVASLDWEAIEPHDFYESLRKGIRYKTSQVSVKTFNECLKAHLEQGNDVIYIGCSSALSSSVKTALVVKNELITHFPGRKIVVVDSLVSGMSLGLIAIECAKLRDMGKSIDECEEWVESHKFFYNQCSTVDSLNYLKEAGRVTASSAFFGNLFAVKPIIISNSLGQNQAISKVKGRKSSFSEIANHVSEYIVDRVDQTIWIGHADCEEEADELAIVLKDKMPEVTIDKYVVGPIVGSTVGPGTLIVNYKGQNKGDQTK